MCFRRISHHFDFHIFIIGHNAGERKALHHRIGNFKSRFILADADGDGVDRILGLEQLSDERRMELGVGAPPPKPKKEDKPDAAK